MDKVTVIIPVYNSEKYLDQCVNSVLGQTHTDLDILLVTEPCDDRSEDICDRFAAQDERIRVFHKKKLSGVSRSRNIGIKHARGSYITFVDSDDYIGPERIERVLKELKDSGADILQSNFTADMDGKLEVNKWKAPTGTYSLPEAFKYILGYLKYDRFMGHVLEMLVPVEKLYDDSGALILFDTSLSYAEDVNWKARVLLNCRNVYLSDDASYVYRVGRSGSAYEQMYNLKTLKYSGDAIRAYGKTFNVLKKNHIKEAGDIYTVMLNHKLRAIWVAKGLKDTEAKKKYMKGLASLVIRWPLAAPSCLICWRGWRTWLKLLMTVAR